MRLGLTGLSMSSHPWRIRPAGPKEGQKFAHDLGREKGPFSPMVVLLVPGESLPHQVVESLTSDHSAHS